MTRYVFWGRFGPNDMLPAVREGEILVGFDLVAGRRVLGLGIGRALYDLSRLGVRPTEVGIDLIVLAAHVHAADTRLNRFATSQDAWTREISLVVPVSDPALWGKAVPVLKTMLRFLTGDHWDVTFRVRAAGFENLTPPELPGVSEAGFDGIALFSGGLDSLIGAIDRLIEGGRPLFVSHSGEGAVSKPQRRLFDTLAARMVATQEIGWKPERLRLAMEIPRNLVPNIGEEDSTRGRSFLFFAAGVLAGSGLGRPFDLRVPENGLIALNVPLDPTRLGSNTTRTTHPFYINRWNELLQTVGLPGHLWNPYWDKTKGEMVAACGSSDMLRKLLPASVSCAHPSLGRYYHDNRAHCGTCVPCLIRHAAVCSAWRQDPTGYRCDDLTARPLDARKAEGQQIRGFQYALARLDAQPDIASVLVYKPGPLREDLDRVDQFASVYLRGMKEVGHLLTGVRTFSSAVP